MKKINISKRNRIFPFSVLSALILFISLTLIFSCQKTYKFPFLNPELSFEQRANDLVGRMTLDEKISQMMNAAPAIPRLEIPEYNWWNECLHGVARAGIATVFPQAIGLGATWNEDLIFRVSTAISDEARAKHHKAESQGKRLIYQGLTFWTPNINIFRDPRWGRGQETYGEDPFVTGRIGDYNPGGRLPVTIYKSIKDLPSFEDYNMKNRTYRYFTGEPLYPFGYGLSY